MVPVIVGSGINGQSLIVFDKIKMCIYIISIYIIYIHRNNKSNINLPPTSFNNNYSFAIFSICFWWSFYYYYFALVLFG